MRKEKKLPLIYLIVGLLAFCYILLRWIKLGVTYDEVWTIRSFVPNSILNIVSFTPCDANNHTLNTLLIKFFLLFDKESLLLARLPNVLAFIMYAFYGYKIAHKHLSPLIGISCFLLLLLNPFLLDFFSIARGYGLGLAFVMASTYFTLNYLEGVRMSSLLAAVGFASIAVLCNFSLLNYWIVIVSLLNAIALFSSAKYNFKKTFLFSICISILLFAIVSSPIRKLIANGNLYYGGHTGFYSDTLVSLAKYSFYSPDNNTLVSYSLNIFLLFLFLAIIVSFYYNRKLYAMKSVILSITILCVLSLVSQHYLLGTLYLIDRTALFFYPLLIFSLCFSLNDFAAKAISKLVIVIVFAFGANFFSHANLYKTAIWYFDAHSAETLSLINEKGKQENRKMKIDFSWPFECSFAYYIKKNNYQYIEFVKNKQDRNLLNTTADYYIYLAHPLEKVNYDANSQQILSVPRDTVKQYKNESIFVFDISSVNLR